MLKKERTISSEKAKRNRIIGAVAGNIGLALLVFIFLIPIIWLIFLSLKSDVEIFTEPLKWYTEVHWENYTNAFRLVPFGTMLSNSAFVVLLAVPTTVIFDIFVAFAIGRMRFGNRRLQNGIFRLFVFGVIAPTSILMFPVYLLLTKLGLYDNIWAVVLTHIGWGASMNIMIMVSGFRSVPDSLEEAAVIDGCNIWQLLWKVLVPVAKPVIATCVILTFLGCWNDFALAKVMLNSPANRTISLAASYFKGQFSTNYALTAAGSVILVVPQLIVFVIFQRYIIDGVTAGAVKG